MVKITDEPTAPSKYNCLKVAISKNRKLIELFTRTEADRRFLLVSTYKFIFFHERLRSYANLNRGVEEGW